MGQPATLPFSPLWHPLGLSFAVATIATLLALCIGIPIAALLARRRFFGRELLDAVLCLPLRA